MRIDVRGESRTFISTKKRFEWQVPSNAVMSLKSDNDDESGRAIFWTSEGITCSLSIKEDPFCHKITSQTSTMRMTGLTLGSTIFVFGILAGNLHLTSVSIHNFIHTNHILAKAFPNILSFRPKTGVTGPTSVVTTSALRGLSSSTWPILRLLSPVTDAKDHNFVSQI